MLLTQDENLYLPEALATVCRELGDRISVIVAAPPMSTHRGFIRGLVKHVGVLGLIGTWRMTYRVAVTKLRGLGCTPTRDGPFFSIRTVAKAFGTSYFHVRAIRSHEFVHIVELCKADLLISMSCPQVIGKNLRDRFPMGCINVHGAPLPKYRGLMPAFWVLKNGEASTATTVHDLAAKLDDGDILVQAHVAIDPGETWDTLVRKTKMAGARALVEAVLQIEKGTVRRRPNPEEQSTYYSFPTAQDGRAFRRSGKSFF